MLTERVDRDVSAMVVLCCMSSVSELWWSVLYLMERRSEALLVLYSTILYWRHTLSQLPLLVPGRVPTILSIKSIVRRTVVDCS